MSEYEYSHDMQEIFRAVWGYTAFPPIFLPEKPQEADKNYSFKLPTADSGEAKKVNTLGVEYYAKNANGIEMFLPIWLIKQNNEKVLLQNTVSNISNRKTIIETPLVNRQGTVKEEIAITDWTISVRGVIVSQDRINYPDEMVSELKKLYAENTALGIENARTSLLLDDSEKVVIKSLAFPELSGRKHCQSFEMELVSDLNFDLYII
jgi:hypothetical protein